MRFAASIEMMFTENGRPAADRVRAAADAGFAGVEIWDWRDKDVPTLRAALDQTGLELVTACVEHWSDKCALADRHAHPEFLRRVADTIDAAAELGTRRLVVLGGDRHDEVSPSEQRDAVVDVLRAAADLAAASDMTLLLEVVNREIEGPRAVIDSTARAFEVIDAVGSGALAMLYDRYHAVLNGEDLEPIAHRMDAIGHIQVADVPGRGEPGSGEIDWRAELGWLDRHGYTGFIGLECTPTVDSRDVLARTLEILRRPAGDLSGASSEAPASA